MNTLTEFISSKLNIPSLDAGDPIMDGCFYATPYYTDGIRGNGNIQTTDDYILVDIFYEDKSTLVTNTKALMKAINDESSYYCENPSYSYEEDAGMYHAAINLIIIGGIS